MMKTFARPRLLVVALYIASAALVTVQQAVLRHSNNVSIFRSATFNLFAGRDLYAAHPEQHFDFCKYSPTFAVLFAPLAYLPFALTFLCWTLLNGLLLWYALDRLLPEREATVALALLYLERSEEHTSELQSQSNLVCRLLLEKKNKSTHCRS